MTVKNPNPPATDPFFYLAIAELLTGNRIQAYDLFYKCLWSNEHKNSACYYLGALAYAQGRWEQALSFAQQSLACGASDTRARMLLALSLKTLQPLE